MAKIKGARETLLEAFNAAGVPAYYGWGAFNAPCIRIHPGEPWITSLGFADAKRVQHWEVWAVGGRVDANATYEDVEALVSKASEVLYTLNGWTLPTWARPGVVIMGGVNYYAARGTIETRWEV